jgi:hypothetical protein
VGHRVRLHIPPRVYADPDSATPSIQADRTASDQRADGADGTDEVVQRALAAPDRFVPGSLASLGVHDQNRPAPRIVDPNGSRQSPPMNPTGIAVACTTLLPSALTV